LERTLRQVSSGRDRWSAITAFNESFYRVRSNTTSVLKEVAYEPWTRRDGNVGEMDILAKHVARVLANEDWVRLTGLSYRETLALPYSEWLLLYKAMSTRVMPGDKSTSDS